MRASFPVDPRLNEIFSFSIEISILLIEESKIQQGDLRKINK